MLDQTELHVLSYYRACELAGSILFGRLAFQTQIDEIRIPMTQHCLEEAEHAWLWTQTIQDLGAVPTKVTQVYQTEFGKAYGMPGSMLEIFCLTQVFEKRTLEHFGRHLKLSNVRPEVAATLQKMIDDEAGHIGWIAKKLAEHEDQEAVAQIMETLRAIDEKIYVEIMSQEPYASYFKISS